MNEDNQKQQPGIGRIVLLFSMLVLLNGCAIVGGCPISPHLGAHAGPRLEGGGKTPLILRSSHYTIPPIKMRALPPSLGCPVIPPDLVHAKPRPGL